uniref:protein S100-A10b isoform X1 n=2 Tax=Solea senegalensis TaxID=28829 RepID=UPI001CD8B050|nr:protein S100-A10b isoform X1 [Solea senegalensis]
MAPSVSLSFSPLPRSLPHWALSADYKSLNKLSPRPCTLHGILVPRSSSVHSYPAPNSAAMTELERIMEGLINIFHNYGSKDSHGWNLNKKQLKTLMEKEVPSFLHTQKNPHFLDKLMKDLDEDKTDKLNFEQFMRLVVGLSATCERAQVAIEQVKAKK